MPELQPINQESLVEFLVKLADFHATLPAEQQHILDDMTAKAMSPVPAPGEDAGGDVAGYALGEVGSIGLAAAFQSPQLAAASYYRPQRYYYYY